MCGGPNAPSCGGDHRLVAYSDAHLTRASAVLANFKQAVKDKPVRIPPIVSQLVDPAVLEKMKVRSVGEAEKKT